MQAMQAKTESENVVYVEICQGGEENKIAEDRTNWTFLLIFPTNLKKFSTSSGAWHSASPPSAYAGASNKYPHLFFAQNVFP